jgi:hypothetical protein
VTHFDKPVYKTSKVAEAAAIQHGTLRAYFSRGHWRVIGKAAESQGLPNLFSLRDALTFAVAARLIEWAGVHPKAAFDLAVLHFAHIGDDTRAPAHLFNENEHGLSLLVYYPEDGDVSLIAEDSVSRVVDILPHNAPRAAEAATVIVLNPTYRRVCHVLGVEVEV